MFHNVRRASLVSSRREALLWCVSGPTLVVVELESKNEKGSLLVRVKGLHLWCFGFLSTPSLHDQFNKPHICLVLLFNCDYMGLFQKRCAGFASSY